MNTHEVQNQAAPWVGANHFECNPPLQAALRCHAPALDATRLRALGALAGSAEMQEQARLANIHKPQLHTHDVHGRRIDHPRAHRAYRAYRADRVCRCEFRNGGRDIDEV